LAPAPGSQVPSMAFATGMQARLPLGPLARGFLTTPQASLHAADWPVAPRPASTPGSRPTPGAALPGTLASPRAGLPPAGCRELVARLRRRAPPFGGPRRPSYWTHIPAESPDACSSSMPRRSCGMLSDSRNEWKEAVTAPVRTRRRSPHVRTAVGMFDEHRRQQDARRRQFEVR
jgi:hypothetical protein